MSGRPPARRAAPFAVLLVASLACSSSSDGDGDDDGAGGQTATAASGSGAGAAGGASGGVGGGVGGSPGGGDVCLPDGVYGKCSENAGCFCLLGATVYQFCTVECTDVAQCGDARDTPGAVPGCYPINPGAEQQICALTCGDTAECPCGLTCMPSGVPGVDICAELQ